jgi:hypothetical protein
MYNYEYSTTYSSYLTRWYVISLISISTPWDLLVTCTRRLKYLLIWEGRILYECFYVRWLPCVFMIQIAGQILPIWTLKKYYWAWKIYFKFSIFLHSSIKLFWNMFSTGVINSVHICYSSISSRFPGYTTKNVAEKNLIGQWTVIIITPLDYFPCKSYFTFPRITVLFIENHLGSRHNIFLSEIRAEYYLNRSLRLLLAHKLFGMFSSWAGENKKKHLE